LRIRYSTAQDGSIVKKALVYTADEHGIDKKKINIKAITIIEQLRHYGYSAYIVGGAVRDIILGIIPKDFDIVTDATPPQIRNIFSKARIIGNRFRLVHVPIGNEIFEVCTFRSLKDGLTGNTFGGIEEDVLRRDFTVNALFYDPLEQIVVDYVGGMKDVWEKKLKPIIPLNDIFSDDPVRMIRAIKYATTTGFKIPLPVQWKIRQQAELLATISTSRRSEELSKIIHSHHAADIIKNLDNAGLFMYLQPNAVARMHENNEFRTSYFQTLKSLNDHAGLSPPELAVAALVRDYLEDIISWTNDYEQYAKAFTEAQQFIRPINLPRADLDKAVRLLFRDHAVIIEASWNQDQLPQPRKDDKQTVNPVDPAEDPNTVKAVKPERTKVKKNRRFYYQRRKQRP
jgi:poly(A) polymerase